MALWVVIIVVILLLVTMLIEDEVAPPELAYSEFLSNVEDSSVESVIIEEGSIKGKLNDGTEFTTYAPVVTQELITLLREHDVRLQAQPKDEGSFWRQILIMWFPLLLFIGLWIFFIRQMQSGGGKAMSFGKSKARMLTENEIRVTFADVAGIEESKFELQEIIEFLKEPKKYTRLGGRIPKGVLLVGPPGTGKTLLARAVAGEASVPFFAISGSDFVEMFVGVGASRVRDLFLQGKKHAPCIIFIDEIDAVGRHRGAGLGGGHDEREQTLNQLLVEMDGFESNEGVILVAATNRPDVLDPALLRAGRFDRRIMVDLPDVRGREGILKVHSRHIPLADDVDLWVIARGTPGFSGADLENLANEAALIAARRDRDKVGEADFAGHGVVADVGEGVGGQRPQEAHALGAGLREAIEQFADGTLTQAGAIEFALFVVVLDRGSVTERERPNAVLEGDALGRLQVGDHVAGRPALLAGGLDGVGGDRGEHGAQRLGCAGEDVDRFWLWVRVGHAAIVSLFEVRWGCASRGGIGAGWCAAGSSMFAGRGR